MKKMICLTLALICLTASLSALAEETFTLRCGIHFGDDLKTVYEKETWSPNSGQHIFSYTGTLMEVPAMVHYYSGEQGLNNVMYILGTVYGEDGSTLYSRISLYETFYSFLKTKYGILSFDYCLPPALSEYIAFLGQIAMIDGADIAGLNPAPSHESCWLVSRGGGKVMITLAEYRIDQGTETRYVTLLNYWRCTEAEIAHYSQLFEEL